MKVIINKPSSRTYGCDIFTASSLKSAI